MFKAVLSAGGETADCLIAVPYLGWCCQTASLVVDEA